MSLLPPTSEYLHFANWSIRNFHMCPPWEKIIIFSPPFDIRLVENVTLGFCLESQGPGNGMMLGLYLYDPNAAFEALNPTISMKVWVQKGTNQFSSKEKFEPATEPEIDPLSSVLLKNVYPGVILEEKSLSLFVVIKTSVNLNSFWSNKIDMHLLALSSDLVSQVTQPCCSDFDIESEDSVSTPAHTCILKARVTSLFDGETANVIGKKWMTGLSADAVRTMMFYLYGRLTTPIPENQKQELTNFAMNYGLTHLESVLKPIPSEITMASNLDIEDIFFSDTTANVMDKGSKFPLSFKNISTLGMDVSLGIASDQSIEFTFKIRGFERVAPIYMKGTVKLTNELSHTVQEQELSHIFSSGTWTTASSLLLAPTSSSAVPGSSKVVADFHRPKWVVGNFQLSEAVFKENEVVPTAFKPDESDLLVFNDLQALGDQLRTLYTDQVDCDLKLRAGGQVYGVHKAIAVARSPAIRRKVSEEETDPDEILVIDFPNVQPEVLEKVILYMYSGRIEPCSPEVMVHVKNLAERLQMHLLAEECAKVRS